MNSLTNREIKTLINNNQLNYKDIKPIIEERFKVFTRVQIGNAIYRIDLISKQNDKDISLFRVLNNVYEYKELSNISIYLKDDIRWFKKN